MRRVVAITGISVLILVLACAGIVYSWTFTPHGRLDVEVAVMLKLAPKLPPPGSVPAAQLRQRTRDQMIRFQGRPVPILHVEDRSIPGPLGSIPVRVYRPSDEAKLPIVVYFHGGGFTFGDLDTVLREGPKKKKGKLAELLKTYKDQAILSKRLVTIELNCPIKLDLEDLKVQKPNIDVLVPLFRRLEFRGLADKLAAPQATTLFAKETEKPISAYKTVRGGYGEATILRPVTSRLIFTRDIRHPIRGPEPPEGIRNPDQFLGELETVILSHQRLRAASRQSDRRCGADCPKLQ